MLTRQNSGAFISILLGAEERVFFGICRFGFLRYIYMKAKHIALEVGFWQKNLKGLKDFSFL